MEGMEWIEWNGNGPNGQHRTTEFERNGMEKWNSGDSVRPGIIISGEGEMIPLHSNTIFGGDHQL